MSSGPKSDIGYQIAFPGHDHQKYEEIFQLWSSGPWWQGCTSTIQSLKLSGKVSFIHAFIYPNESHYRGKTCTISGPCKLTLAYGHLLDRPISTFLPWSIISSLLQNFHLNTVDCLLLFCSAFSSEVNPVSSQCFVTLMRNAQLSDSLFKV